LLPFGPEPSVFLSLLKNVKLRIYKTITLSVVLYGCEHRLRVLDNRARRRLFGPKRAEETGGWRKLHIEELHDLPS
jgi:hypothetical protein